MSATLNLLLPAHPEHVATARRAIGSLCDDLGIQGSIADDIRLAVSEACTACVQHSHAATDPTFGIGANLEGDTLLVDVRDFAGGLVRGPLGGGNRGLGIQLVRHLAEWTDVSSGSTGGLRVAMRFATHER